MFNLSICFVSFFFLFLVGVTMCFFGFIFCVGDYILFIEWELFSLLGSSVVMTILFDWMSLIFMGFVLIISSLVIFYSEDYMHGDSNILRFIFLVLMFVLSMVFLIISPNLISILLGWDGLGLVSYCLVIYYQNIKSYNAGMLTALSNRLGDVALLMAIAWMLNYGSWNYIFYLDFYKFDYEMYLISLLVMLASMTSSAQIPFSSWLPAAMAAPTPVSALVHSSTLVTAGVYLMIRFYNSFNNYLLLFMLFISSLTMFMAGLGANFEYDLKSIIALSTLSQLGLMMGILSIGFPNLSFFHLLTHALFKALLFMCAGMVIHLVGDCQDIRYMGCLSLYMPITSSCMIISNFALCGMPFLAGFYSKDLILEMVGLSYLNIFIFFLFFFSTGLTVCYTLRLIYYSFCGDLNLFSYYSIDEDHAFMLIGMGSMVLMSVIGGSLLSWLIFPTPVLICLPLFYSNLALIVSLLGGWVGYYLSDIRLGYNLLSIIFYRSVYFYGGMWFMPFLSTYGVIMPSLSGGYVIVKDFDFGWSEYYGGQGMFSFFMSFSNLNQWFQYNNLKFYLMLLVMWLFIILFI
uniref:NADH dehydrogenase subunit 5 n=1 Tax=Anaplecta omei TaxID=2093429 RepID=UPI0022FD9B27|nr:NADH dehydrogenase subunit 5 [Anaplecta omei]WAX39201.1 NADH dehydrogenase subunit 5 [Anaplecta omei]